MGKYDKHEFVFWVKHETDKAYLCKRMEDEDDDDAEEFWLPKSQTTVLEINERKSWYTVELPEWLAEEKGLV